MDIDEAKREYPFGKPNPMANFTSPFPRIDHNSWQIDWQYPFFH